MPYPNVSNISASGIELSMWEIRRRGINFFSLKSQYGEELTQTGFLWFLFCLSYHLMFLVTFPASASPRYWIDQGDACNTCIDCSDTPIILDWFWPKIWFNYVFPSYRTFYFKCFQCLCLLQEKPRTFIFYKSSVQSLHYDFCFILQ